MLTSSNASLAHLSLDAGPSMIIFISSLCSFTFKSFIVLSTYFTRRNKLEIKKKSLFVVYVKYPSVPFTDQPKFCEYIDKIDADETEEQDKSQEGVQIKIRSRSQPLQVFSKKHLYSS